MTHANAPQPERRRLWIITELYYPENNQTGYYMTHIGEGLANDFDVKVICSQPNYAVRGTIAPKREVHKGVEIFRVRGTTLDKNVLPLRLINMLTNGISVLYHAFRKIGRNDEVLTVSAPPSLPFLSAFAAKLKGVPYSLIVQDKYPETLVATDTLKADSFFVKVLSRANRWLYSHARRVIVIGRDMEELVKSEIPKAADNVVSIPNWAALEEVESRPREENQILKDLGLEDKFVFLYAGNMGHPQDVESILECADKLNGHNKIRFVFIGSGVKRKWVEGEVNARGLTNVILLDPLPREQQTLFLNACDVGFVSLVRGMYGVAMPSRTYNFLAAGKPILALTEHGSEVERVVTEERVGWAIEPQDPDLLLQTIEEIFARRAELPAMSERARHAALTKYDLETAVGKYRKAMR